MECELYTSPARTVCTRATTATAELESFANSVGQLNFDSDDDALLGLAEEDPLDDFLASLPDKMPRGKRPLNSVPAHQDRKLTAYFSLRRGPLSECVDVRTAKSAQQTRRLHAALPSAIEDDVELLCNESLRGVSDVCAAVGTAGCGLFVAGDKKKWEAVASLFAQIQ